MLRAVERAVLSQCWFHVNSPFICADGGLTRALMSEQFVSRRVIEASRKPTKTIPETAVLPDKFTRNLSSSSLCAAIAFMMQFGVQREGAAHLRDRLTLRLLKSHHTAATVE